MRRAAAIAVVVVMCCTWCSRRVQAQPDDLYYCTKATVSCYQHDSPTSCVVSECEAYIPVGDGTPGADICTTSKTMTHCVADESCSSVSCRVPELFVSTAPLPADTRFNIDLVVSENTTIPEGGWILFEAAARRWEQVIVGNLPPAVVNGRTIDDLEIRISFEDLGEHTGGLSAPSEARDAPPHFPITGTSTYNSAKFDPTLQTFWFNIILHEFAHVLGIGTAWPSYDAGFIFENDSGGCSNEYSAPRGRAKAAFLEYSGLETAAENGNVPPIYVSDCGHWSRALKPELMIPGSLPEDPPLKLSKITIGALDDLGYEVDYTQADPYTLDRAHFM